MTNEEIAEEWTPLNSVADAEEAIADQKSRVLQHAFEKVHKHAIDGDLESIAWLEGRGLIDLPREGNAIEEEGRNEAVKILKAIFRKAEDGQLDAIAWLEGRGLIDLTDIQRDEHSEAD